MRAKEILAKGNGTNKHIILITDGGPTLSFKATGSKANGRRPIKPNGQPGDPWEPIYKPTSDIPNTYNDVSNSGLTYNGRASGFDFNTLRGDGTFYQFGTSKGDTNQLAYSSYWADNEEILDSVYATISTVRIRFKCAFRIQFLAIVHGSGQGELRAFQRLSIRIRFLQVELAADLTVVYLRVENVLWQMCFLPMDFMKS